MSKIKSLLLTGSLLITIICTGFSANATERHLLEQTISYEDLGNRHPLPPKLGGLS